MLKIAEVMKCLYYISSAKRFPVAVRVVIILFRNVACLFDIVKMVSLKYILIVIWYFCIAGLINIFRVLLARINV